jgi:tetratricopeptide (TPR) repeat protein
LDLLTVRFSQAFDARESLKAEGPEWDADVLRYEEAALALLQDAEELDVPSRLGSGHFMLSEVALHRDDPDTALAELLEAIERYEAAGRPWSTAHPRMALAQTYALLGRSAEAEAAAHAAMETAARWPRLEFAIGYARQLLANVTNAQGRFQDSARHALEAAAWADRNADPELASGSRYTLAYAYEQLDRPADAAAVLESAMPDIAEHLTEPTVVEARWILGRSLSRLGDHRGAAEHILLAARVAEEFPHQSSHAQLAAAAGHALKSAGMLGEARQAFAKSVELLRGVDDPVNLAKTLRALAWTVFEEADADDEEEAAVRDGGVLPQDVEEDDSSAREEALDTALLYFADAEQLLEAAFEALEYPGREPEIAFEIAETQDQLARLHLNSDLAEKALPYAEKAASGFRTLLPARVLDYDFSEQMVAWLLDRFLTRDAAIARLEQAIVTCEAAGVEAVRCAAYLEQLRSG